MFHAGLSALLLAMAGPLAALAAESATVPPGHPPMPNPAHADAAKQIHEKVKALHAQCDQDPKALEPRLELANLYLRFGYADHAAKLLDEAVALRPDQVEAYQRAGLARFELKDYDKAIALWRKALELKPDDKQPEAWIAQAQRVKDAAERLAKLEADLAKSPDGGALHREAGELLARLGRWPEAAKHLAEAVRLLPKDPAVRRSYGIVLFRAGRMDEAIAELETCVKLEPTNTQSTQLLDSLKRMRDMHREMKKKGE